MGRFPIILIILVLILILGVIAAIVAFKNKKKAAKPDYYSFYIIGISWFAIGITLDMHSFSIMGLVFAIIGITNKDKWKKNRRTLKGLSKKERAIVIAVLAIGIITLIIGIVFYYLAKNGYLS